MTVIDPVLLCRLEDAHTKIDELTARIAEQDAVIAEQDAVIAGLTALLRRYENENMSTSTNSGFNDKVREFRKRENRRGSDELRTDKADKASSEEKKDGGKQDKRDPRAGYENGIQNNPPSEKRTFRIKGCPHCGGRLRMGNPVYRLVTDLDQNKRQVTVTVIQEGGCCELCGTEVWAPMPFIPGTAFGPRLLGMITELFDCRCTDRMIRRILASFFEVRVSESAISNARRAVSAALGRQMELIRREFLRSLFVQMDETGFKKGRAGTTGYVWIAVISRAIWAVFAPTRAAAVLQEHFGWLLDKAVVADGLRAYQVLFRYLQRCWRHLLARAEAEAVTGDAGDEARYDRLKRFYRRIKKMKTQDPFTTMYLTREIRAILSTFPDGKLKTHLTNAVPYMFTFLAFRDMPPQNNDAELAIRDNIVVQRNVRHHITTPGGREVFSRLVTFAATCRKNGMSPYRAVIEMIRNPEWDMFHPGPWAGEDWCVFDVPESGSVGPTVSWTAEMPPQNVIAA